MAAVGDCLRAVGLQFWADSLQALPALLAPAVLLGLLLGAAAAALLCRCALGPRRGGEVRGEGRRGGRRGSAAGEQLGGAGEVCEGLKGGGPGRCRLPALPAARDSLGCAWGERRGRVHSAAGVGGEPRNSCHTSAGKDFTTSFK